MRKSSPDFGGGQWFDVLKAAGNLEIQGKSPFTAPMLSLEAKMKPTTKKVGGEVVVVSPEQVIAAAWLRKLEKWGYVERVGSEKGGGPRLLILWRMTPKGKECRLRESLQSRFDRLYQAAVEFREAKKKKWDEAAKWTALSKVLDEVTP